MMKKKSGHNTRKGKENNEKMQNSKIDHASGNNKSTNVGHVIISGTGALKAWAGGATKGLTKAGPSQSK
eukprot:5822042-Amphidinium_carterae.1